MIFFTRLLLAFFALYVLTYAFLGERFSLSAPVETLSFEEFAADPGRVAQMQERMALAEGSAATGNARQAYDRYVSRQQSSRGSALLAPLSDANAQIDAWASAWRKIYAKLTPKRSSGPGAKAARSALRQRAQSWLGMVITFLLLSAAIAGLSVAIPRLERLARA